MRSEKSFAHRENPWESIVSFPGNENSIQGAPSDCIGVYRDACKSLDTLDYRKPYLWIKLALEYLTEGLRLKFRGISLKPASAWVFFGASDLLYSRPNNNCSNYLSLRDHPDQISSALWPIGKVQSIRNKDRHGNEAGPFSAANLRAHIAVSVLAAVRWGR